MHAKPNSCSGCVLDTIGRGFTAPEGNGYSKLLILGDASDENSFRDSLPLRPYSQSGAILERIILGLRRSRSDFIVTNTVRCCPPQGLLENTGYEWKAINHCKVNLDTVIAEHQPKAILALGNVPLKVLSGLSGKKKSVTSLRGYVLEAKAYGLPMIATYHPAYIARGKKNLIGIMYEDFAKALKLAKGELVEGRDYYFDPQRDYKNSYCLTSTDEEIYKVWKTLKDNPTLPMAFDIETSDSLKQDNEDEIEQATLQITQFQVSIGKGHALVIDASIDKFLPTIANFMNGLANPKLSWNGWRFDCPVLEANGVTTKEPHYDLMTAFHHWNPDIPAGLQFAASLFGFPFSWKHLAGEDLAFYGACDVDALHWIYEPLKAQMIKEGIW